MAIETSQNRAGEKARIDPKSGTLNLTQSEYNYVSKVWEYCLKVLAHPEVSEMQSNGATSFFIKRNGKREKLNIAPDASSSNDPEDVFAAGIKLILAPKVKTPFDFKLGDSLFEGPLEYYDTTNGVDVKARCHIVLPPACDTPQITIAKRSKSLIDLDSIASRGSMSEEMLLFLKTAIKAKLNIVFSGGTGSGKALHKDTLIPTPSGFKTVEELNVGDTIFDETGQQTKILKKYCPHDEKSFEITFSNGEKVKCSAGHLWKVSMLNKKEKAGSTLSRLFTKEQESVFDLEVLNIREDDLITRKQVMDLFQVSKSSPIVSVLKKQVVPVYKKKKALYYNKKEVFEALYAEMEFRNERVAKLEKYRENTFRPSEIKSAQELFDHGVLNHKNRKNFAVEKVESALVYEEQELPVDPYVLGAWLGDGISDRGALVGTDAEIKDRIENFYTVEKTNSEKRDYQTKEMYTWYFEGLKSDLKKAGVLNNKSIPEEYIYNSVDNRKKLIAGLIDTDGHVAKRGYVELAMVNEDIINKARKIVSSLGWNVSKVAKSRGKYKTKMGETVLCKEVFTIRFYADDIEVYVPRKKDRLADRMQRIPQSDRIDRHYINSIVEIADNPEDYFCFMVDSPSHLFLCTENLIPTHNTTMLEACTKLIPHEVRIGVAEDTPELSLAQPNVTYLHSTPLRPGYDEDDFPTLPWAVRQFQRMRLDMIIIGETRGKEFTEFLVAANSGFDGSLTTLHANTPKRALERMSNFALKGSERMPLRAINNDIANGIDIIVQLGVLDDGRHKVKSITEVTRTLSSGEDATITAQELYAYDEKRDAFIKESSPTDKLSDKFRNAGINTREVFKLPRESVSPPMGARRTGGVQQSRRIG